MHTRAPATGGRCRTSVISVGRTDPLELARKTSNQQTDGDGGREVLLARGGGKRRATDGKSDRGGKKKGTQPNSLIIFTPNAARAPFFRVMYLQERCAAPENMNVARAPA